MSGGYFDYNQFQLSNLADDLKNLLDYPEKFDEIKDKESFIKEVEDLIKMLNYSSKVLHHIDYFLSCDIGEESMWKRIIDAKKESRL